MHEYPIAIDHKGIMLFQFYNYYDAKLQRSLCSVLEQTEGGSFRVRKG